MVSYDNAIPPIADVKVTPIAVLKAAVVPNAPKPPAKVGSKNRYPPAPIFASRRAEFKACLPGNSRGLDFRIP